MLGHAASDPASTPKNERSGSPESDADTMPKLAQSPKQSGVQNQNGGANGNSGNGVNGAAGSIPHNLPRNPNSFEMIDLNNYLNSNQQGAILPQAPPGFQYAQIAYMHGSQFGTNSQNGSNFSTPRVIAGGPPSAPR